MASLTQAFLRERKTTADQDLGYKGHFWFTGPKQAALQSAGVDTVNTAAVLSFNLPPPMNGAGGLVSSSSSSSSSPPELLLLLSRQMTSSLDRKPDTSWDTSSDVQAVSSGGETGEEGDTDRC